MRRNYIKTCMFLVGLFGLIIMVYFVSCGINHQGPRLEFEEYVKDLGRIPEGVSQEVFFKFRNTGSQDLLIYGIEAECSCQDIAVKNKKIPPGGNGILRATIKPVRKSGSITDGIIVKSTDTKRPTQYLKIKRFVILNAIVKPERLTIKCQPQIRCPPEILTVAGPIDDHKFEIMRIDSSSDAVNSDFRNLGTNRGNRRLWEIKVTVDTKRDKPIIPNEATELRIVTSNEIKPTLVVPLTIIREVPVGIQPKSLVFILGDSKSSPRQQISVTYSDDNSGVDGVDIEPYLNEPSDININLVSKQVEPNKVHWVFEAIVNDTNISDDPVRNGKIYLKFVPSDISISVPFTIVQVDG